MGVVLQTDFKDIKLFKRGKVRDMYDLGDYYLMVSSDRLSAFDVIMNEGIPEKGRALTQISKFWFDYFKDEIENHIVATDVKDFPDVCKPYEKILDGRSMIVKKAELIQLECIVRGYITGSGWNDYQRTGQICGIDLPEGLRESEKLPEPIFTPSTKAEIGDHDENISEDKAIKIVGKETYDFLKNAALNIYKKAAAYAEERGIILADTKMEFGFYDGKIILIDELLTPDSSRFWSKEKYEVGRSQESFDKQYVRDYLLSINFNKQPPPPKLPENVILNASKKYREALKLLTGKGLE
ncbi:MAG: phosphoribosylaminoimidazolesuccinocarboxamide synthase [Chlorobi bacterium]|nr:phosphoribosylaminoimidazolesuccinocarboxamide synthase [Chlorobiota bacterium]